MAGKAPLTLKPPGTATGEDTHLVNWVQNSLVLLKAMADWRICS